MTAGTWARTRPHPSESARTWAASRRHRHAALIALTVLASLLAVVVRPPYAAATDSDAPTVVSGTEPQWQAVAVAAAGAGNSNAHACAVTTAGGLKCWGYGGHGQLGANANGNVNAYPVDLALSTAQGPATVPTTSTSGAVVASGGTHSCAIVNTASLTGAVQCWGNNNNGQLGNNSTAESASPVYVLRGEQSGTATVLTGVTAVAAGAEGVGDANGQGQTCALAAGEVFCWGEGGEGRLGNGATADALTPKKVLLQGTGATAKAIAVGDQSACAVVDTTTPARTGGVQCWGNGGSGRLGTLDTANHSTPVNVLATNSPVPSTLANVKTVAVGWQHACATTATKVFCWGDNSSGQLGQGDTADEPFATEVPGISAPTGLAAGGKTTCAVSAPTQLKCWGENGSGQIGIGSTIDALSPTTVQDIGGGSALTRLSDRPTNAVSVADAGVCATLAAGTVTCWGHSNAGQVGDGKTTQRTTPVYVNGTKLPTSWAGKSVAVSKAGDDALLESIAEHACAVDAAGGVRCWGHSAQGQIGDGATGDPREAPVAIALNKDGGSSASVHSGADGPYVASSRFNSCAIVDTAATPLGVQCWGSNSSGTVGDGTTTQRLTPVVVAKGAGPGTPGNKLTGATAISLGGQQGRQSTACAVVSGGVFCWGEGSDNLLGQGASNADSATPVQAIAVSSGAAQVGVGDEFACALVNGGVKCWGDNTYGQVGDATNLDRNVPTDVKAITGTNNLADVVLLGVGQKHACAVSTSAGTVCWGDGSNGKLGNGATANANRPVAVTGLGTGASVTSIDGGLYSTCAVVSGGVKCWGRNDQGQLGNDGGQSTIPVDVQSINDATTSLSGISSDRRALSVGSTTACAVQTVGRVLCWGNETVGSVLGSGLLTPTSSADDNLPVAVDQSGVAVDAGHSVSVNLAVSDADRWTNAISAGAGGDESPTVAVTQPAAGGAVTCGSFVATSPTSGHFPCTYSVPRNIPAGPFSFTYTVEDSHDGEGTGNVSGNIGLVIPTANGQSVSASRGVAEHIVLTGSDPNGDTIGYLLQDMPTKGSLVCSGTNGEDCSYTAGPGQTGSDSFTFTVTDGSNESDPATVSIDITNEAPAGDAISTSAPRGIATEVVLTGSDPNADPITFTKASDPTKGTVSCSSAGVCSYTAGAGQSGTDSFTFTVSDGSLTSDPATATITITNQAPVADARAIDAGRHIATPVTLSGSDPNGDAVTFAVVDQPTKGTVTCGGADGSDCSYQSDTGASGTDSFTYQANDGDLDSAPKTVTITLVNSPPAAVDQAVTAPRGVPTPVTLAGTDDNGDANTFSVVDQPSKGTLTCGGTGNADCTYTAGPGATGTDTFTYKANDGSSDSAAATVTVTITNQAPTANTQTVSANAPGTGTPITLTGSDPNSDALDFEIVTQPTKGTLVCSGSDGSSCSYTATAGRTGNDSFTFRASDGFGGTATSTVHLQLDSVSPGVFVGDAEMLEPESTDGLRAPQMQVTLSKASAQPVTVWYYTVAGTATGSPNSTSGGDFFTWGTPAKPKSVTIAAGSLQATIAPPVLSDNEVEGDESFAVRIVSVSGGNSYVGSDEATVKIIDTDTISDGRPVLAVIGGSMTEGNDGSRQFKVRLELSRALASQLKVTYATQNGTAIAGTDYVAKSGTITFAPGDLSKTIDVKVNADTNVDDLLRSLTLDASVASGPSVKVAPNTATLTIRDED